MRQYPTAKPAPDQPLAWVIRNKRDGRLVHTKATKEGPAKGRATNLGPDWEVVPLYEKQVPSGRYCVQHGPIPQPCNCLAAQHHPHGDNLHVKIDATFMGLRLALNELLTRTDLDEMRPATHQEIADATLYRDMGFMRTMEQRKERRRRFVDMIATNFAEAITRALFEGNK